MKKLGIICALFVLVVSSNVFANKSSITKIDADALQKMWTDNKDLVVIDARGGKYFDGTMIKGAGHLPVNEVTPESLAKHIATKETPVVFYCVNLQCPASSLSAHKAKEEGYSKLFEYSGGIEDWVSKGLPTVQVN